MPQLAQVPKETEFFVLRADGMADGPYLPAELAEMLRAGHIDQQTRLRPMGRESWIPAFKVLEGTPDLTLIRNDTAIVAASETPPLAAPAAFHPHAPMAALVAGVVGLIAWTVPLMGIAITLYGGYQGSKVLRTGSGDPKAFAGVFLCCLGFFLTLVNSAVGVYLRLTGSG